MSLKPVGLNCAALMTGDEIEVTRMVTLSMRTPPVCVVAVAVLRGHPLMHHGKVLGPLPLPDRPPHRVTAVVHVRGQI